jgi:hypothetical protein
MNKQFMYVNGNIVVSDEVGMKPAISYRDNIEDILILENEIEFLEKSLKSDNEKLESKKEDRSFRNKDSIKISIIGSAAAVGVAFGMSHIAGISHEEITNTIMGPMSEYLAFSIPMSVGLVGFVQGLSLLGLSYRPSKKEINGLEEAIKYEKQMIEMFKEELQYLEDRPTFDKKDKVEEMVSYNVHYKSSLEYLSQAIRLRYVFGYNRKRMINLHRDGKLFDELTENGFSDDVIMDFAGFIENYLDGQDVEVQLGKK